MNLATRRECCLFHASVLEHSNSTVRPWWVNPWTVMEDEADEETEGVGEGADIVGAGEDMAGEGTAGGGWGCMAGVGDDENGSTMEDPIADAAG
mmetsp:Transcript_25730/g.52826  ORF Transcript_25730/g.52826 Transcript_25730/m.52826 type:complete len:94 (+) Transcript_25730:725-1006(+)